MTQMLDSCTAAYVGVHVYARQGALAKTCATSSSLLVHVVMLQI